MLLKAQDELFEAAVPFQGSVRVLSVDFVEEISEVALRAGGEVNEVCRAELRTRRKIPWPVVPCPP